MVRKGFAGAALLIAMLIIAAIDVSYIHINWGPFNSPEVVRSVTLHQEYYTMDNALGLAKLYLDTSLRYSVYQGMYDNGYRGGFSRIPEGNLHNSDALWYDNKDIYLNEEGLLKNLTIALENLGSYTKSDYVFLDNYNVKLPQYAELKVGKNTDGEIGVNASADRNLWIMKTMQNLDRVELEKSAGLEENFGTNYPVLYQNALARLEEVKSRFMEMKTELENARTGTLSKEQEGSQPQITELEVFQKVMEDAGVAGAASREDGEARLRTRLEDMLNKLKDQAGETVVKFEKTVSFTVADFLEQEDCTKQETQRSEGDKTFYKTTMTCSFKYSYEFVVKVSVTDNSGRKYPVFDSNKNEVAFMPLTMVFAAMEKS